MIFAAKPGLLEATDEDTDTLPEMVVLELEELSEDESPPLLLHPVSAAKSKPAIRKQLARLNILFIHVI